MAKNLQEAISDIQKRLDDALDLPIQHVILTSTSYSARTVFDKLCARDEETVDIVNSSVSQFSLKTRLAKFNQGLIDVLVLEYHEASRMAKFGLKLLPDAEVVHFHMLHEPQHMNDRDSKRIKYLKRECGETQWHNFGTYSHWFSLNTEPVDPLLTKQVAAMYDPEDYEDDDEATRKMKPKTKSAVKAKAPAKKPAKPHAEDPEDEDDGIAVPVFPSAAPYLSPVLKSAIEDFTRACVRQGVINTKNGVSSVIVVDTLARGRWIAWQLKHQGVKSQFVSSSTRGVTFRNSQFDDFGNGRVQVLIVTKTILVGWRMSLPELRSTALYSTTALMESTATQFKAAFCGGTVYDHLWTRKSGGGICIPPMGNLFDFDELDGPLLIPTARTPKLAAPAQKLEAPIAEHKLQSVVEVLASKTPQHVIGVSPVLWRALVEYTTALENAVKCFDGVPQWDHINARLNDVQLAKANLEAQVI